MNTRNLLITLSVAALSSINVMASNVLLSPRALDNQPKAAVADNSDVNLAAPGLASASPRVLDNQVKTVPGKSAAVTPSMACTRHMAASPKIIGECADHPGAAMPCCAVAGGK